MDERRLFALVTAAETRPYVRMIIERMFPTLAVLSQLEIARGFEVKPLICAVETDNSDDISMAYWQMATIGKASDRGRGLIADSSGPKRLAARRGPNRCAAQTTGRNRAA
jgi:hypothetical protein